MAEEAATAAPRGEEDSERERERLLPWTGCAALSGLLIYLSFPPPDLGFLGFFAFVPLIVAVGRVASRRRVVLLTLTTGAVAYVPAFAWVGSVGWICAVGVAAYVMFYLLIAIAGVKLLQKRVGALWPLAAAGFLTGVELLRARIYPGFPWLFLGYTQYRFGALLQMAAFGGVYLVSFVLFFFNTTLAYAILARLGPRPSIPRRPFWLLLCSVALLVLCVIFGTAVRHSVATSDGPAIGVVQQNMPMRASEAFARYEVESETQMQKRQIAEVELAVAQTHRLAGQNVALVAWSENSVPVPLEPLIPVEQYKNIFWVEDGAPLPLEAVRKRLIDAFVVHKQRVQDFALGRIRELADELGGCHFLVGAPAWHDVRIEQTPESVTFGMRGISNRAVFMAPDGSILGHYDKVNLVPFGEYIPLVDHLPFLSYFTPFSRGLIPGREETVFELPARDGQPATRFAALICYDDAFAPLTSSLRRKGAAFMVNTTYEGWYHIPGELRQHVAMAVFRAVETRTTMVRAANTGVCCFIDPRGDVYASLEPNKPGALAARVRLCATVPPYVRTGDAFAWTCLLLSAASAAWALLPRRKGSSEGKAA